MNTRTRSMKNIFTVFNFLILCLLFANCADKPQKAENLVRELTEEEQRAEIRGDIDDSIKKALENQEHSEKVVNELAKRGAEDLRYVAELMEKFRYYPPTHDEDRRQVTIIVETISGIAEVHPSETIQIVFDEMLDVGTRGPNGFNTRIVHGGSLVLQKLDAQFSEEQLQKLIPTIPALCARVDGEFYSAAEEVARFLIQSGDTGQKALAPLIGSSYYASNIVWDLAKTEPIENPELLSTVVTYISHVFYGQSAKAAIAFQGARMLDPIYAAMDHATPSGSRHSRKPNWQGSEPVIYATVDLGISLLLIESPALPLLVHVAKYSNDPIKAEVFSSAILFDENKYESILLGINHEDPRVASMALMILSLEMNNDEIKPDQKLLEAATNYYNKTKNTDERNLIVLNDFWGEGAELLNGSTAASFDIPDIAKKLVKDFWDIDLSP